jgi:hypothetical protein
MISFAPVVLFGAGWMTNVTRFATREEAEAFLADLAKRWLTPRPSRIDESDEPVNYQWRDGCLIQL